MKLVFILGFASIFLYFIIIFHREKIQIHGKGDHLIIMLHGFYGSPSEFDNIVSLFNEKEYTIIRPGFASGYKSVVLNLNEQSDLIYDEILYYFDLEENKKPWTRNKSENDTLKLSNYKKISFIGNSQGGIIAKLLCIKTKEFFKDLDKINFITIATPHLGIGLEYFNQTINIDKSININKHQIIEGGLAVFNLIPTILNYDLYDFIKYKLSYFTKSSYELRSPSLYVETENEYFIKELINYKKVINYILSGYDLNVPFYSSSYNLPNLKRDNYKIEYHNITLHTIEREFYTVPIHSLLAHGTIIGKWKNAFFTWDKYLVDNSMKHIVERFN
jgi:hypothetical protein